MAIIEPADQEAQMRASWPSQVQMAARIRDLEEALAAAEERAQDERRRRDDANRRADSWMQIARNAGVTPGCQHLHADPDRRIESYQLDAQRSREQARRADDEALRWRNTADQLAAVLRTLTKLPVPLKQMRHGDVIALASAIAPIRGEQVALPADVVSAVCQRAVELHMKTEMLAGGTPRGGVDACRGRLLARLGYPALADEAPPATGNEQADLFGDAA